MNTIEVSTTCLSAFDMMFGPTRGGNYYYYYYIININIFTSYNTSFGLSRDCIVCV